MVLKYMSQTPDSNYKLILLKGGCPRRQHRQLDVEVSEKFVRQEQHVIFVRQEQHVI